MKTNTKKIMIAAIFAALYSVGVIFLAPVSFGVYQVRLADAMLPLSIIFGIPSAIGFGLGCVVSNFYGGLGIIDIVFGAVANFLACTVAWYVGRKGGVLKRLSATILITLIVTVIVGGYLSLLFDVPLEAGLLGLLVGSIVAINFIGFPLEEIIRRSKFW